jgi:hypothetical protein
MSQRKKTSLESRSARPTVHSISLGHDALLFDSYVPAVAGLGADAERAAATVVKGAPRGGSDPRLNTAYMNDSQVLANLINEAIRRADLDTAPLVEHARQLIEGSIEQIKDARELLAERTALPHKIIEIGGIQMSVADTYATLDELQKVRALAESRGDTRHLEKQGGGIVGLLLALGLTGFEVTLWALAWNPTTLPALVMMITGILVLGVLNHWGLQTLGHLLRTYRVLRDARREAHRIGHATARATDIEGEN